VHVITRMGAMSAGTDRDALERDVQRLVMRYYSASLAGLPIAQFLGDVMTIAFRHKVRLPADLALLARTVVVLEGVASSLDPTFVLADYLEPFVVQLLKERVSLKNTLLSSIKTLREFQELLQVLPQRVVSLAEQLQRGAMTIGVDLRHLDRAMRKLDAIANRLSFSIIVAGIVVGSALIMLGGEKSAIFRLPFTTINLPIPQIGFVMAGLLGVWLLFSIVRSKGL
jgi:ubiquinone biosynthesis protein